MTNTSTTAAAISGTLRRGGLNPLGQGTPRSREGIRVSRSLRNVRVALDVDSDRRALRLAADARDILAEAGYELGELSTEPVVAFDVTGRH